MTSGSIVRGYWLNRAFNDLREPAARTEWLADLDGYLAKYPLTDEEKRAVTSGDWPGCIALGASVYTLTKVGATIGVSLLVSSVISRWTARLPSFLRTANITSKVKARSCPVQRSPITMPAG